MLRHCSIWSTILTPRSGHALGPLISMNPCDVPIVVVTVQRVVWEWSDLPRWGWYKSHINPNWWMSDDGFAKNSWAFTMGFTMGFTMDFPLDLTWKTVNVFGGHGSTGSTQRWIIGSWVGHKEFAQDVLVASGAPNGSCGIWVKPEMGEILTYQYDHWYTIILHSHYSIILTLVHYNYYDLLWSIMIYYDLLCSVMIYYVLLWSIMIYYDLLWWHWYTTYYDLLWYWHILTNILTCCWVNLGIPLWYWHILTFIDYA